MEKINYKKGAVLVIDKHLQWTSFNVVAKLRYTLRRIYNIKKFKVGHAGTLDPLATGVLVICTGKKTKTIPELQEGIKEYTGTIRLGATTPSFDLETEIDQYFPTDHITKDSVAKAAKKLTGQLLQTPPVFSAKKIDGKRAYDKARKGEKVEMKKSLVTVHEFQTTLSEKNEVNFKVVCSKGTYIRSLAYDLGKLLNSGGHLTELRRIKSGEFTIEDSLSVEEAVKYIEESAVVEEES